MYATPVQERGGSDACPRTFSQGDIRRIRAQQRREIMRRVEMMESTFEPEVNRKSSEVRAPTC